MRNIAKGARAAAIDLVDALLGRACPGCGGSAPRERPICDACDAAVARTGSVLCLRCMESGVAPDPAAAAGPYEEPAGPRASAGAGCPRHGSDRLLLAGPAYAPPLDRILHAFKYAGAREVHAWIAALVPEPPGADLSVWREYVLVPVPLHPARRAWRGFDQARLIAATLGRVWGIPVADALVRRRDHAPQARLHAVARRENVRGAFCPARGAAALLRARPILLVDDVATTGSTLLEAASAADEAGPAWILALAASHGGLPDRPEPPSGPQVVGIGRV